MDIQTPDWNKFRTFYYVAKLAFFTKIAKNLHMTHTALRRSIASLEASLNIRFLNKLLSRCVFTRIGKVRLKTVDAMLNVFLRYGEKLYISQKSAPTKKQSI